MDIEDKLQFLNERSDRMLDRQVESYRQIHAKSGTIIGVIALFIPFFLNGLDDASRLIKMLSVVPVAVLCWAMWLLLMILRSRPLFQGLNLDKLDTLINNTPQEVLLFDIGANRNSYRDNEVIMKKQNSEYNFAIRLTIIAIICSSVLLLVNKIFIEGKDKKPTEVKIVNFPSCGKTDTIRTYIIKSDTIKIPIVKPKECCHDRP